jgi:hypothetical protein
MIRAHRRDERCGGGERRQRARHKHDSALLVSAGEQPHGVGLVIERRGRAERGERVQLRVKRSGRAPERH